MMQGGPGHVHPVIEAMLPHPTPPTQAPHTEQNPEILASSQNASKERVCTRHGGAAWWLVI
jgi:hypothetical protein